MCFTVRVKERERSYNQIGQHSFFVPVPIVLYLRFFRLSGLMLGIHAVLRSALFVNILWVGFGLLLCSFPITPNIILAT